MQQFVVLAFSKILEFERGEAETCLTKLLQYRTE
jgi:hypothetical protein